MATDVSVIVDGNSVAFLFNSGWAIKELGEMYRGTSWYPRSDSNGSGFVFHFEGVWQCHKLWVNTLIHSVQGRQLHSSALTAFIVTSRLGLCKSTMEPSSGWATTLAPVINRGFNPQICLTETIRSRYATWLWPQKLTMRSSMLETRLLYLEKILSWTVIAPLFFTPVVGVETQASLDLVTLGWVILMAPPRTVVRLLVTPLHFGSQVRRWSVARIFYQEFIGFRCRNIYFSLWADFLELSRVVICNIRGWWRNYAKDLQPDWINHGLGRSPQLLILFVERSPCWRPHSHCHHHSSR